MKNPFRFLKRLRFSRDMLLALTVLGLISDQFGKVSPDSLSRIVFQQLPAQWQDPQGPATEGEFLLMVSRGIDFYRSVRGLVSR